MRGVGKTFDSLGPSPTQEVRNLELSAVNPEHADCNQDCYVWYGKSGKREEVPVFKIESLSVGNTVIGPAMVIDETQTIFVNQYVQTHFCMKHWRLTGVTIEDGKPYQRAAIF